MKELLLIAIGSALVNNVVLSQFLGLCPFLGVSKNVKTSAGMGAAVIFRNYHCSICYQRDLQGSPGRTSSGVFADHRVHPGYCGPGAVCRNVFKKNPCLLFMRRWEYIFL